MQHRGGILRPEQRIETFAKRPLLPISCACPVECVAYSSKVVNPPKFGDGDKNLLFRKINIEEVPLRVKEKEPQHNTSGASINK